MRSRSCVGIVRCCVFAILILTVAAACVNAQDLGSSNKIFSGKKATAEPAKKAPVTTKARIAKPTHARTHKAAAKPAAKPPVRIAKRPAVTTSQPKPVLDGATLAEFARLIADGNDAVRRGAIPEAESLFEHAAAIRPGDPTAFVSLGRIYYDTMRWEAAEHAFRSALVLEPNDQTLNMYLSRVLAQPVMSAELSSRYEEAERLARTAMRLSGTAAAYDQLGAALERRGLIGAEAESAYRQAIAADRQFAPAYAHLGRLLRRNGKMADAAAAYKAAMANAVGVGEMTAVAASFQSEQRYAESISLLSSAVHLEPRNYTAMVLLGRALAVTGDRQGAETHLIMATRLSPLSFAAFAEMGRLYIRQGKPDMAASVLERGGMFADRFERAELALDLELLGDLFAEQGNRKAAERSYTRSLELDASRPSTSEKLARVRR